MPHASVLISGAGQLGSRYLQGLARSRQPLSICVHDISSESLVHAERRWNDVARGDVTHSAAFHTTVDHLPKQFDIAIVATTANVRPQVVQKIAGHADVRYWVLEKVLAQSEAGLDEIRAAAGASAGAWVNTPRRMMPWHREIKARFALKTPVTLTLSGGSWGLACNAVHFLDLVAWWTGETLQEVGIDRLGRPWFEAKRPGNWEVLGTLEARFSGGSRALLTAGEAGVSELSVTDGERSWQIRESEGAAHRSDGLDLPGRVPYQSEMSSVLVESILESGGCELPTLQESVALHRVFIRAMREHWTRAGNGTSDVVPIT